MQRATQDVEGIRMFVNLGVIRLVYVIILLVATLTLMLRDDWQLALLSWVFIPPTAILAVRMTTQAAADLAASAEPAGASLASCCRRT